MWRIGAYSASCRRARRIRWVVCELQALDPQRFQYDSRWVNVIHANRRFTSLVWCLWNDDWTGSDAGLDYVQQSYRSSICHCIQVHFFSLPVGPSENHLLRNNYHCVVFIAMYSRFIDLDVQTWAADNSWSLQKSLGTNFATKKFSRQQLSLSWIWLLLDWLWFIMVKSRPQRTWRNHILE